MENALTVAQTYKLLNIALSRIHRTFRWVLAAINPHAYDYTNPLLAVQIMNGGGSYFAHLMIYSMHVCTLCHHILNAFKIQWIVEWHFHLN